ncbi:MAG: hypothetical protein JWR10_4003 [Rubritepida sp.]|nr:hypothetical protein [Rubritepida sp.]
MRAPPPDLAVLTDRVARLYGGASRFSRGFVRGKLLTDPATPAILRLAAASGGFGAVADLGCGRGQVGLALLLAGLADSVAGLDLDADKIRDATRAAAGLPASYAAADLGTAPIPDCDTVLIFDVLLQMHEPAQRSLLARMAAAARRRIIIRAFDPDCGWRAQLGTAMEQIARRIRRDGSVLHPLPLREIAASLEAEGFCTQVAPCWGWTPLPNVMLIAERALI